MTAFNPYSASGSVDPFSWTEARGFGATSASRPHTRFRPYVGDKVEWQKSIYALAAEEQDETAFDTILDVGCGNGEKSHTRFADHAELIQIDRKDFRSQHVRNSKIPFRSVSLESWDDLDELFGSTNAAKRTLIICADVIEHLFDPRPLLAFIRRVLLANEENCAILSSPDHERIDGGREGELPSNAEHVRQWSVFGFGALLRSAGFTVQRYGIVPMHEYDQLGCTIFAKLTCSSESYASFLTRAGLPQPSPRLYVTSEHKALGRGGGIGTYSLHSDEVLTDPTIFLMFGGYGVCEKNRSDNRLRQILHVGDITCGPKSSPSYTAGSRISQELLDAVKTLVFFFPELRYIEYDDYLGHAHAIAQAKETAILPTRLTTICHCHGNHHYLEVNHSQFFFDHELHLRERICAERSDLTLIPSNFVSQIYKRAGIKPKKEIRLALPYKFRFEFISGWDFKKIRRVVFFGKRTRGKGYNLFGEAINLLAEQGDLDKVEEIIIAGIGEDIFPFHRKIESKVINHLYPADQVVEILHAERIETLAVIPYLGDNFPYSIHELIDAGVQAVFARAGGVPEVLDGCDPEGTAFFDPKPEALAKIIREKLVQNGIERADEVRRLRYRFQEKQASRNETYQNFKADVREGGLHQNMTTSSLPAYDVVITFHNEQSRYLIDALASLESQSLPPAKVVVVNDDSRPERLREAEAVVAAQTDLDVRIVSPNRNLGLADARNFGRRFVENDFFIVHDVDNMLRGDAAERMLSTLIANPDVAAATSYNVMFPDHENWAHRIETGSQYGRYEPTGPDLGEFEANTFGDALAMYRRSMVEDIGGWRNSGVEPLEDFELFYTLVSHGYHVAVVPEPIAMYRVREDSMLRTYDRFAGYRRLADVVTQRLGRDGLSIVRHAMEAHFRQALVDRLRQDNTHLKDESEAQQAWLRAELREARAELELLKRSRSWRLAAPYRRLGDWLKSRRQSS